MKEEVNIISGRLSKVIVELVSIYEDLEKIKESLNNSNAQFVGEVIITKSTKSKSYGKKKEQKEPE